MLYRVSVLEREHICIHICIYIYAHAHVDTHAQKACSVWMFVRGPSPPNNSTYIYICTFTLYHRKMIQLQVHLQLPCYDFCFLYWRNIGELSGRNESACPITCIAPSSETTTGGVYKWQGRNRHSLMSCAYETFLVARPIIAILGPKWVYVIPGFPHSFDQVGSTKVVFLVLTDIVVRVSPRTLRSITDLLLPKISPCANTKESRRE